MNNLLMGLIHNSWLYLGIASIIGASSSLLGGLIARRRSWSPTRRRVSWAMLLGTTWIIFWGWTLIANALWQSQAWPYMEAAAVTGAICSLLGGIIERYPVTVTRRLLWIVLLVAALVVFDSETILATWKV
jgi:hypothetical protein